MYISRINGTENVYGAKCACISCFCTTSMNELIIRTGGINHNILHPAVENKTKIVDRSRMQRFVFAQFINDGTGNMMILNKCIGSFIGPLQSFPEWRINDQLTTSFKY